MEKILDSHYLELLKTLTINIQLSLKSGNLGNKRSKSTGSSVEFSDYRTYMPGDDYRRIDWNAYARFEKVFIKLFMQEQECPVTVFLDKSASMSMKNKKETAIKVAAAFVYVALADYDTVSLISFDDREGRSNEKIRGIQGFSRMMQLFESMEFGGNSDLYQVLYRYQPKLKKGITVVVSDLMYDHQIEKVLRLLQFNKQKVIICHVLSDEEINPVFGENVRIIDSETEDYLDIDTGVEAINRYKKMLKNYLNEIKSSCQKSGVDYILVPTDQPIENFIKHLQSIR